MKFISTRGIKQQVNSAEAIIRGIAKDGGLYVPEEFPKIYKNIKGKNFSYEELAFEIIKEFFTDFTEESLKEVIAEAYRDKFYVKEEQDFLELFHGPTSAFKDAALLFLPQIMKRAKEREGVKEEIVILTATSGDTGKAALEGFSDIDEFKIIVYYPKDGVSEIQERQMITQKGRNVKVIGIYGNFDDAQTGVKEIFGHIEINNKLREKGYILTTANSINIGRLIPQIVYYFYGYLSLVNKKKINEEEEINVIVPTGNFGNILAAYYAKKMGLPIAKFICASNENNVITNFFKNGIYDKRRQLILTESPSMDILVSSNLERLLFEAYGRDSIAINNLMNNLDKNGEYEINKKSKEFLGDFYGGYATKEEVYYRIKEVYDNKGYLMDTHTAVAYEVLQKYINETNDKKQYLIAATASPYKFPRSICKALGIDTKEKKDFELLEILKNYSGMETPQNLKGLRRKPILHDNKCEKERVEDELIKFLKVEI